MDPLSVLSIAGTAASTAKVAWNVGEALYAFFSDVKAIDHTVTALVAEVKALSSACALVDERLRDIVRDFDAEVRKPRADSGKLWGCIEVQVTQSEKSIAQLQAAFDNVRNETSNKLAQAWRQIKLNMRAKDINEARNRIRSHTASLQTILQTVAIEVCYLTPQRADQQLRTLLGGVEECMVLLRGLRQERTDLNPFSDGNEADILEICGDAVSNGESLYAASVANGSLLGFSGSQRGATKIHQWMADLTAIEETVSRPTANDADLNSTVSTTDVSSTGIAEDTALKKSRTTTSATDYGDHRPTDSWLHKMEAESDDEFQVELAQEAIAAVHTSFDSKDYQEASSYLQEALKMIRELPAKQQSIFDTWDIRYMLSICAYHLREPAEAEAKLLSVIDNSSRSDDRSKEQLRQVCEVGHLLSQLYVKVGNLEYARLYCDNALQGRRRLLGKSHDETYESMALMARIYQLQGSDSRAKVYLRLIHDTKREALENTFAKLVISDEVSNEYKQAQLSEQKRTELEAPVFANDHGLQAQARPSAGKQSGSATATGKTPISTDRNTQAAPTHTANTPANTDAKAPKHDPTRIIVVHTSVGEFHMAVGTEVKTQTPKRNWVDPDAWEAFTKKVRSGK